MKKERPLGRFVALILCALLAMGLLSPNGADKAFAAVQNEAKIAGFSLTVSEGTIGLNIFFTGINSDRTKAVVDSKEHSLTTVGGYYQTTHTVDAKDIGKPLAISLKSGSSSIALSNSGAVNGIVTYSVKDYLTEIEKQNDAGGRLAKALDDYGTCAKYYFDKASSVPVSIRDVDLAPYRMVMNGEVPDSVYYNGSSLLLTDTFSIRHYFFFTRDIGSYSFRVDGKPVELQKKDDLYYIEIPGITAGQIDHVYETALTLDGVTSTFKYSVLSYADLVTVMNTDEPLSKLVKSIYWYNYYFRAYSGQSGDIYEEYPDDPDDPVDPWNPSLGFITYEMFGAKGDGVSDDYDAIVLAHEAANEQNLPVKAKKGATYYIGHMGFFKKTVNDGKTRKLADGAVIKTPVDWTDATFVIDDTILEKEKYQSGTTKTGEPIYSYRIPYGDCYLFTVAPSKESKYCWMSSAGFKKAANGRWAASTAGVNGYERYYLGLDPNLDQYPDHSLGSGKNYNIDMAIAQKNKTFSKDTTVFGEPGEFSEDALYILETDSVLRFGRNGGSGTDSAPARNQTEIIIINSNGLRDESTPLQYDWDKIISIKKYPIDKTPLTVTGGTFITKVNSVNLTAYIHRGIHITRSNVTIKGVEHYLTGESECFGKNGESIGYDTKGNQVYLPRYGAPMQGFFRVTECANVTLKNCVLTNHLRVYSYGNDRNSSAPYEIYAQHVAGLTIDGCVCAGDEADLTGPADPTGIMDQSRWGTTGTNNCKNLKVLNSRINRIDSHMGAYNITIKDSTLGYLGIVVIGYGTLDIERVTSYADFFVYLRRDFGSYWNGDIVIKDCTWKIEADNYRPWLIFANYKPNTEYNYDTIEEDGETYYATLPANVTIDGFVWDASRVTNSLLNSTYGFQVYSNPIWDLNFTVSDATLANRAVYRYPLRITNHVHLDNVTIVRNEELAKEAFIGVNVRLNEILREYDSQGRVIRTYTYNEKYLFDKYTTVTPSDEKRNVRFVTAEPWEFVWQ